MTTSTATSPPDVIESVEVPVDVRRPWRLRDLDRRGRWIAVLLVVLLAIPFAASVGRYLNDGWVPSGDNALIGLRARDVFSTSPPLLGQPSNAGLYAKDNPVHPGPIEFYLLSAPVRLLGAAHGELFGAVCMSFAGVVGGLWALFRRAGPRVAVVGAAVIAFLAWVAGPAALVNPISSNIGGVPLLALVLLTWAVLDGDVRLLPLAAFAFSFVAQQHLAILGLGGGLGAWLVVATVLVHRRWVRARRAVAAGEPVSTRAPDERPYPWIVAAVVVTLVCWTPVILDTVVNFPGNGWDIVEYSRASDHPSQGWSSAVRQLLRAVGLPPFLLRTNVTGTDMYQPLSAFTMITGVAMLLAVGAVAAAFRRTKVVLSRLAVTTLVLALLSLIVASKVPLSVEATRFSFYRWSIVLAIMVALTLMWAVWELLAPRLTSVRTAVVPAVMTVSVAIVAVVSVLAAVASGPRRQLDSVYLPITHTIIDAVNEVVDDGESVALFLDGGGSYLLVGPAVALDLAEQGNHVVAVNQDPRFWSDERIQDSGERVDRIIVLRDREMLDREIGGTLLAEYHPPGLDLAKRIAAQVEGKPVVPSAKGEAMVERDGEKGILTGAGISVLGTDPLVPLMNATTLQYLIDGYLESPVIDRDELIELQRQVRDTHVPDSYEARLLTPAEAAAAYPTAFNPDGTFP